MSKGPFSNGFAASATETVEIPLIQVQAGQGSSWDTPRLPDRPAAVPTPLQDEITEATPPRFPSRRERS